MRSRPGEGGTPRLGPAGLRARVKERLGSSPPTRRPLPPALGRPRRVTHSGALSSAPLPAPPVQRGPSSNPSSGSLPPSRPSSLISGRSLPRFFHPGVGGEAGQRSGDGGPGAPPRAQVRPRPSGPVTQPPRLSRNAGSGGVGCPWGAEWPWRNRAQLRTTRDESLSRRGGSPPSGGRKRPNSAA